MKDRKENIEDNAEKVRRGMWKTLKGIGEKLEELGEDSLWRSATEDTEKNIERETITLKL